MRYLTSCILCHTHVDDFHRSARVAALMTFEMFGEWPEELWLSAKAKIVPVAVNRVDLSITPISEVYFGGGY